MVAGRPASCRGDLLCDIPPATQCEPKLREPIEQVVRGGCRYYTLMRGDCQTPFSRLFVWRANEPGSDVPPPARSLGLCGRDDGPRAPSGEQAYHRFP